MCSGRSSIYAVCCTRDAFRTRSDAAEETDTHHHIDIHHTDQKNKHKFWHNYIMWFFHPVIWFILYSVFDKMPNVVSQQPITIDLDLCNFIFDLCSHHLSYLLIYWQHCAQKQKKIYILPPTFNFAHINFHTNPPVFLRSLTLWADNSCSKPCGCFLAGDGFVSLALAEGQFVSCTLHTAHHHVSHVTAIPVPRFLNSHHANTNIVLLMSWGLNGNQYFVCVKVGRTENTEPGYF